MSMKFRLPGYLSDFELNKPIVPNGSFTWGEALHGGTRIPVTREEVINIMTLASNLQAARNKIGRPFYVTSWYRPEPFNTAAGGVSNSQHLNGKAVDFWVDGYSGVEIAGMLSWWSGGLGTYRHFPYLCHLDIGPYRRW